MRFIRVEAKGDDGKSRFLWINADTIMMFRETSPAERGKNLGSKSVMFTAGQPPVLLRSEVSDIVKQLEDSIHVEARGTRSILDRTNGS